MMILFKLNLKAAVEREKAVQAIDVYRKCTNCVVTFWVMSQFLYFLGASRGCADFRNPTAVFRIIVGLLNIITPIANKCLRSNQL